MIKLELLNCNVEMFNMFNPFNMKGKLFYLNTPFALRSKHFLSQL